MKPRDIAKLRAGDVIIMKGLPLFVLEAYNVKKRTIVCYWIRSSDCAIVHAEVNGTILFHEHCKRACTIRDLLAPIYPNHPLVQIVKPSPMPSGTTKQVKKAKRKARRNGKVKNAKQPK